MAALNFPSSPTLNQVFTSGDRSWKYNGVAWQLMPRTTDNTAEGTTNLYYTDARVAAAPAVTLLRSDLDSEVSTRTSEIARIDDRVNNVLENLDPVKIDSFTEVLSKLAADKSELSDAIVALGTGATSGLGEETAARIAADSDLQDAIDAEVSAREAAVLAEQTARETADDAINATVSTLTDSIPDRVRAVLLSGLELATNAAITASDSVLSAFGKLQAQVTAAFASIDSEVSTRTSEISRVDDRIDATEGAIAGLGTMSAQNANNVNITGGTITGVNVNAGSIEVGQGSTADLYVGLDGKVGIGTETPSEKLTVNGHIDILGGRVKNLGTPVDATDAVTKGYVDTAVSGVQSALDTEISDRAAAVQNLEDTKQIKLVISDTAPAHIEGREWVDTTDFRRYMSIGGMWIESVTA